MGSRRKHQVEENNLFAFLRYLDQAAIIHIRNANSHLNNRMISCGVHLSRSISSTGLEPEENKLFFE